jgi:hypothetical protein
MPKSNGCHHGSHLSWTLLVQEMMAAAMIWLLYVVSFVSVRLLVDFCSNMISLSIEQQNGTTD